MLCDYHKNKWFLTWLARQHTQECSIFKTVKNDQQNMRKAHSECVRVESENVCEFEFLEFQVNGFFSQHTQSFEK